MLFLFFFFTTYFTLIYEKWEKMVVSPCHDTLFGEVDGGPIWSSRQEKTAQCVTIALQMVNHNNAKLRL